MKEEYQKPDMEVYRIETENVLVTGSEKSFNGQYDPSDPWK